MSKAAQQRVIEEHQATIKRLRSDLAQAKRDRLVAEQVYTDLTDLCDTSEAQGLKVLTISTIRSIKPRTHGVYGGVTLQHVEDDGTF